LFLINKFNNLFYLKIRPLNILERDQSMLNVDQWNDLSNLVNCLVWGQISERLLSEEFSANMNQRKKI
jgi:hypothetical protein